MNAKVLILEYFIYFSNNRDFYITYVNSKHNVSAPEYMIIDYNILYTTHALTTTVLLLMSLLQLIRIDNKPLLDFNI